MKKADLIKILKEDKLGLFDIKPKASPIITSDERLIASFIEINDFIEKNEKEPEIGAGVQEHKLATRLKALRSDSKKTEILHNTDKFQLLSKETMSPSSIEDILKEDELGIFDIPDSTIFDIKNVPVTKKKEQADFVAKRKVCKDFSEYEQLFIDCQTDLASGARKLIKFESDKQIQENSFFILNGVLLFIESIGELKRNKYGKLNGRQRCIFENGTESKMLIRSLVKRLYENGHAVSERLNETEDALLKNFNVISEEDEKTGFIYVLKSLSKDSKITSIDNLYKIGFSTIPVEERIKGAENDPTYLMAPVSILTTFECFNLNPQKLEHLLHSFFGSSCLNMDIYDKEGKRHSPREWFIAPINVIEKAIKMIITGAIVNYKYDPDLEDVVYRS
jgi:hypothetical protein